MADAFGRTVYYIWKGFDGMLENTHILTTRLAVEIFNHCSGRGLTARDAAAVAKFSADVDHLKDLEIVDVEFGRDDPHTREFAAVNDIPRYGFLGKDYTALNHFIDIKKGAGRFDDYDGYSYRRGSACREEYESIRFSLPPYLRPVFGHMKVDQFIHFGLNDEYVHAFGQKWYRNCSPALVHYSFPQEKGRYPTVKAELAARFPLADALGQRGKGVPHSVFMPVDNLGRYWYEQYLHARGEKIQLLGAVLHAVQDACVPHHAAGYNGNWHEQYEKDLDRYAAKIIGTQKFYQDVKDRVEAWQKTDSRPPAGHLRMDDRRQTPNACWGISQCVTWCALHAYAEYALAYKHFRRGYRPNTRSMYFLHGLAASMSVLVLLKARQEVRGNRGPLGRSLSSGKRLEKIQLSSDNSHRFDKRGGEK